MNVISLLFRRAGGAAAWGAHAVAVNHSGPERPLQVWASHPLIPLLAPIRLADLLPFIYRSLEAAAQPSPPPPQPTPSAASPTASSSRPPPPTISASAAASPPRLPPSSSVSSSSPAALSSSAAAQNPASLQDALAEISTLRSELQVSISNPKPYTLPLGSQPPSPCRSGWTSQSSSRACR